MQALEGRPTQAISRPSPSSEQNSLRELRQKDGALVTALWRRAAADRHRRFGHHRRRLRHHGPEPVHRRGGPAAGQLDGHGLRWLAVLIAVFGPGLPDNAHQLQPCRCPSPGPTGGWAGAPAPGLPLARSWCLTIAAQTSAGAIAGAVIANLMFDLPAVAWSHTTRSGANLWLAEIVATTGLLVVIVGLVRSGKASIIPAAVGAYIGAAYWFTSSTSFANPAVTIGRAFTDTYAGIAPASVRRIHCRTSCRTAGRARPDSRHLPGGREPPTPRCPMWKKGSRSMPEGAKPTVLFVCVHNAGRSQMAAGWLRHLAGDRVRVLSAGSAPKDSINPVAVEAMAEVGIDITGNIPQKLEYETAQESDVIVTMGCGDACPYFPGKTLRGLGSDRSGRPADRGRAQGS